MHTPFTNVQEQAGLHFRAVGNYKLSTQGRGIKVAGGRPLSIGTGREKHAKLKYIVGGALHGEINLQHNIYTDTDFLRGGVLPAQSCMSHW